MIALLAALAVAARPAPLPEAPPGGPSPATVVYYNARMALADGQSLEAVKLWLLRNALAEHTGEVSIHDGDFHSVTWAALGDLGVCADGLPDDVAGAGLWPLATFDWVVRNRTRKARPGRPDPFEAFQVDRQMRLVSIGDVLAAPEIREVTLFRGKCVRPRLLMTLAGEGLGSELSDRQVATRFLLWLVDRAEGTLRPGLVRGRAVLAARRFDLHLQLAALDAAAARAKARQQASAGRQLGLSRASAAAMLAEAPLTTLDPGSAAGKVLRECVDWPTEEWLAISPDRRRFLFQSARTFGDDPAALDRVALGLIDALAAAGEGAEVVQWIGLRAADPAADPALVWGGDRGARLLALDDDAGFPERGPIALQRGVDALGRGDLPEALRSLAYALQRAPESAASAEVARLSRRWLSYVAGRFELTDELLVTLRALVPARDYAAILEDLLWRSAFHADAEGYARGLRNQPKGGALERRTALLTPLASGDVPAFAQAFGKGMAGSPSETLRFLDQLLDRLELEDEEVRDAQAPMLLAVERILLKAPGEGRARRQLEEGIERCRGIRDGVGRGGTPWDAVLAEARDLSPAGEVFVGSVRLAPSDALPWPFRPAQVAAPSVFEPIRLIPTLWRDDAGELVFGWSLRG